MRPMRRRFLLGMAVVLAVLVPPLAARASLPDRIPLFAAVFGTQVIGQRGDLDSRGALTLVTPGPDHACFGLDVVGMAQVTSVEVRQGGADETGPVLFKLTPLPSSDGSASGCLSGLPASDVSALRAHPDDYYLNVATSEFPSGAARGQFFPTPDEGSTSWLPWLVGAGLVIVGGLIGFLVGRRGRRRPTFEA